MAIVRWNTSMSLDGFIAGPEDAMDCFSRFTGPAEDANEIINATGAILASRRTFDVGRKTDQLPEAQVVGPLSGPSRTGYHRPGFPSTELNEPPRW
jgi:hypothetical protein